MKRTLLLAGLAIALAASTWAVETVPSLVNFQGALTDNEGAPLASGTYTLEFRIWDKPVAGDADEQLIWGHSYEVLAVNGRFNVILGGDGGTGIEGAMANDITLAFTEAERYLGITVVGDDPDPEELAPRQRVLSAPYALHAHSALNGLPPGSLVPYAGAEVPTGFILCDGRAVSRTTYEGLFLAIGVVWGAGDGSTTFNVPDFRGKTTVGAGDDNSPDLTARALAHVGGEETHVLTVAELPPHTHTFLDDLLWSPGSGTPQYLIAGGVVGFRKVENPDTTTAGVAGTPGALSTPITNMPPFAVVNYIIKY
ncbi:MAG TPA: tail fiber protein [Candidatus Bathyarchaeia archaeon]|nr:tail fiber protein [Candidatus Bathyarchaeia archaeon]